jgi:isopentenyl-diphosphate delta-isomerase
MSDIEARKASHLRICLEENVQFNQVTNGLDSYRFGHCCLPELDRNDISIATKFLGKPVSAPLLISSMTGGTDQAKLINQRLAQVAQNYKLAMGVGSQRVAIERPDLSHTFEIRKLAPDILLFANIGAIQLNYEFSVDECKRIVDSLEADALVLHINPLQECIQSNGDTNFKGLLAKIENLCHQISIPIVAKEVGNGISGKMARLLIDVGISAIDVAGAGGTSWAKVESQRADNLLQKNLGISFADWGIPTAQCLEEIRIVNRQIPLIASGGIRNGIEVSKAIALGADLAGLALPFLHAAMESSQALDNLVRLLIAEITTVLFCTGNNSLSALQESNSLLKY